MDSTKLDDVGLLRGMDPAAIAFVAERMQEVTVPTGGHVVKQGDYAYRLFAILEGKVVVSSGEELVATLGAGDVFGEMALVEDLRRGADVIALIPTTLASLMSWDFREAVATFPEFAERVNELVVSRS